MFLGKIYAGYDIISNEDVAIKFEPQSSKHLHLENEYNIYKSIGNHIGVPRLKWFGQEHNQRVLVLSLLGPSLENIFVASGCRFQLRTVLAIANQMVYFCLVFITTYFLNTKTSFPISNLSTLDTSFTAISNPRIFLSVGASPFALSISSTLVSQDGFAILAPSFTPLTRIISR
jgi:serine/threonine protein kinase